MGVFLLFNHDIELACDEAVVRKIKGDYRSAYAMTLVGVEERRRGFPLCTVTLAKMLLKKG